MVDQLLAIFIARRWICTEAYFITIPNHDIAMSKKSFNINLKFQSASKLEKQGDFQGALRLYKQVSSTDPLHVEAWTRQMIILRKLKKIEQELGLLTKAIKSYQEASVTSQREWINANQEKVDRSRNLAQLLGLLNDTGLSAVQADLIFKWKKRKDLLQLRWDKLQQQQVKKANQKKNSVIRLVK